MTKPPLYSYKQWDEKKLCSNKCRSLADRKREKIVCKLCGKDRELKPYIAKRAKYCGEQKYKEMVVDKSSCKVKPVDYT